MAAGTLEKPIQITHEHPAKGKKASVVLRYTSKKHCFSSIRLVVKEVVEPPKFILDLGLVRFESNVQLPKRSILINDPAERYPPLADLIRASKPLIAPKTTTLTPPSANGVHRNGSNGKAAEHGINSNPVLIVEPTSAQEPKPPATGQEDPPKTVSIGDSFDKIVGDYEDRIYNCVYRLMWNREDAHDLTQEAFLRAYVALPKVKEELKVGPWLYRIATNLCMDQLRRRGLKKWESLEIFEGREQIKAVAATTPEKEILRVEQIELVHRVLEKLPPKYRAALVLREYQDMSCEEIAEVLGISRSAVKSTLFRAREEFRRVHAKLENQSGSVLTTQPVPA
ncbi:sigma-70 family RNA polymerase sigma factor [Candidatus Daviesbacteria bacterium]|nr:sigma-70 family RNA polymerase sigma factor [Candidatus Daviesbacteria bacterium]